MKKKSKEDVDILQYFIIIQCMSMVVLLVLVILKVIYVILIDLILV